MKPHDYEVQMSRVFALLDEAHGRTTKGLRPNQIHWEGYHPKVYSRHLAQEQRDEAVASLCAFLQGAKVSDYSLEMQAWWRDHQEHDRERLQAEQASLKMQSDRDAALAKLTPYERQLLRVK